MEFKRLEYIAGQVWSQVKVSCIACSYSLWNGDYCRTGLGQSLLTRGFTEQEKEDYNSSQQQVILLS